MPTDDDILTQRMLGTGKNYEPVPELPSEDEEALEATTEIPKEAGVFKTTTKIPEEAGVFSKETGVFLGWPALELTKGAASGLRRQLAEEVGPIADDIQERSLDIMVAMEDLESERVELLDMGPDPERGRGSGTGDWNRQEQRLVEITNELKEQQELLDIETDVAANARQRARGKPHSVFVVDKLTPGEARWFETMNRADLEDMAEQGITRLDDGSIHITDMDRAFQYMDDVVMSHMSDPADVRPPPSFWKQTFLNKAVETTVPGRPPIPSLTASPEGRGAMEAALANMEAPSPFQGVSQADFALADEILRQSMGDDAYRAFKDVSRQTLELSMHKGLSSQKLAQELEDLANSMLESREAEVRVQQLEGARFMPGDAAEQTIEAIKRQRISKGYESVRNVAERFEKEMRDNWPGGIENMPEDVSARLKDSVAKIVKRADDAAELVLTDTAKAQSAGTKALQELNEIMRHVNEQADKSARSWADAAMAPRPPAAPPGGGRPGLVQMAQEALESGTLRDAGGASAEEIIDAWERAQALPAVEPPAPLPSIDDVPLVADAIPTRPPPTSVTRMSRLSSAARTAGRGFAKGARITPFDFLLEAVPLKTPRGWTPPLMQTAGEGSDLFEEHRAEEEERSKARFAEEEYWRTHTVDLNQMSPAERVRYDSWQKREAETEELLQQYLFNPDLGPGSPRPGYLPYLDED